MSERMITDKERPDIDAIEARANAATKGPWVSQYAVVYLPTCNRKYPEGNIRWVQSLTSEHEAQGITDAQFIAHARDDIPALIAYVRELEAAYNESKLFRTF